MNRSEPRQKTQATGVLKIGFVLALVAGIVDVSIALLGKPMDLATVASLAGPILATAAAFLILYLALWVIVRSISQRAALPPLATAAALAMSLFTFFALALLAGLHVAVFSPHTVFRTATIAALSTLMGIGTYTIYETTARHPVIHKYCVAAALVSPLLLFEVLLYEWVEVYSIDSVASFSSAVTTVLFLMIGSATIAFFMLVRGTTTAVRPLAIFVLGLGLTPIVGAYYPNRAAAVRAGVSRPPGAPRQVIFITVDTLRQDAVSAYAPGRARTPAIDKLASDGVLFENVSSPAPWTLPALASVLTGLSPSVHLVTGLNSRLSERVTTVAELLSAHGYRTAAIVNNPLLSQARNFGQGFGEYVDLHEPSYGHSLGVRLLQVLMPGAVPPPTWPTTEDQTALAIDWLQANRDESFFFWVHYFDPHTPYAPRREYLPSNWPAGMDTRFEGQTAPPKGILTPPPETRQWVRALYDAEAREVDANIGRLLDSLARLRLYDDALIVFSSDHGEEFWEHGSQGHGQSLYGELLRVPLIVKLPQSDRRDRVPTLVSTMSIMPTLLDLCRVPFKREDLSAQSLLPLLKGSTTEVESPPVVSALVWMAGTTVDERQAVGFEGYQYIGPQVGVDEELFDRHADPGERHSLAASAPEQLSTARRLLLQDAERGRALRRRLQIENTELGLDEETSRRLRTLGYVH